MAVIDAAPEAPATEPRGLTSADALERLRRFGPNRYGVERRLPAPLVWMGHIALDPMVLLLVSAAAIYFWIGDTTDAIAALVAVAPIAVLDVLLEVRTERALDQLRRLSAPTARALRDGEMREIPAEEVVRGDVLEIREGDVIPADGHLATAAPLHVDESPLTGESEAIAKSRGGDAEVFAGTRVLSGRGRMLVSATGMASRYGAIAELLAKVRPPTTPLQVVIRKLFLILSGVAAAVCVAVVALELWRGTPLTDALITGIGLAMAAIPEEIPVVTTLYLGLGAWRLARDHALIRRLSGVETLGMTTVVCTDKTGTLTEGRIRLVDVLPAPGRTPREVLEAAVLASEVEPFDPLERAIVESAAERGVDVGRLHGSGLAREHPFDPAGKYVSHVWRVDGALFTYAKGSPETIAHLGLPAGGERDAVLARTEELARQGRRLIGVASGRADEDDGTRTADERALAFVGLLAFADPVRHGAREAIAQCRDAHVRVVVITGDHPATAAAVARTFGLIAPGDPVRTGADLDEANDAELAELLRTTSVFARTRPEQKLRIVRSLREAGHVVAVTGDGINDGPALREAHIGVAMGQSGTAVAREAATLVLLDDDFTTIVRSIADGRRIFDNLGRAVTYLIAFHIPLVLIALVVPLVGAPLLLLPLHLVWLEVIVHPTSSLIFEADPPSPELMRRPPRSAASLLPSKRETGLAVVRGLLLTAAVVALYLRALPSGEELARGAAMTALILGQTLLVVTARAGTKALWHGPAGNRLMPFILGASVISVALVPLVPPLAHVFHMQPLDAGGWLAAAALAAAAVLAPEVIKVSFVRSSSA
ncbi:MAG: cation-transporting P-type ATPase [Chloroflexota bacterium]|nr:cation-transporting P-type ATPase [Chloroflexota bacterium]